MNGLEDGVVMVPGPGLVPVPWFLKSSSVSSRSFRQGVGGLFLRRSQANTRGLCQRCRISKKSRHRTREAVQHWSCSKLPAASWCPTGAPACLESRGRGRGANLWCRPLPHASCHGREEPGRSIPHSLGLFSPHSFGAVIVVYDASAMFAAWQIC